jgi:hypothetical protein
MVMVCKPCREQRHAECPGGGWCDCQHQARIQQAEPVVGWAGRADNTGGSGRQGGYR